MIKHIKLNQDNLAFAIEVQNEIFPYEDATKEYTDMVNGQSDANFFLVYNGDDCIGVSGLKHYGIDVEDGFLGWFGILPKYRRLGLGSEALRLLDETARDLGIKGGLFSKSLIDSAKGNENLSIYKTFSKAKDIMMNKRNCARPNSGFQKLLEQKSATFSAKLS